MFRRTAKTALKLSLFVACMACASLSLDAKTHVFLLDKSGSMNQRYTTLRQWLMTPLLDSEAFAPEDRIIVRWFSTRTGVAFSKDDSDLRMKHEPFNKERVLDSIPRPGDTGGGTNIPQGLEFSLSDIGGLGVEGDVLLWLITDNIQSVGGASSEMVAFYNKIANNRDKLFRSAYLFPLVREGGMTLTNKQNAMIMYLLHYSAAAPQLRREAVAGYAKSAAAKINNPVITWFPIAEALIPDPVYSTGEEEDEALEVVDDALTLGKVKEGEPVNFNVRIRFKSRAIERSISGQITNERVELDWSNFGFIDARMNEDGASGGEATGTEPGAEPTPVEPEPQPSQNFFQDTAIAGADGHPASKWTVNFDARDKHIELKPGQTTDTVYTINISNPARLYPANPWTTGLSAESEPIFGTVSYQLTDLKSEIVQDTKDLLLVANGHLITDIAQMNVQDAKSKPLSFNFQFRIQHDRTGRIIVVIVLGLLLIALISAVLVLLLLRTRYELTTPSGERVLAMPLVGKEYISLHGNRAAVISRMLGKLRIAPLVGYTIDGATAPRPLAESGDQFNVINQEDNRGYLHSFRRLTKQPKTTAPKDDFLD
ncbi:MAG TPA: vWA domain-containing protein [Pyrinomonadaceae bacterium]|nr:vWA domain-containing protein [Pyrinomonadaceae bacterium]